MISSGFAPMADASAKVLTTRVEAHGHRLLHHDAIDKRSERQNALRAKARAMVGRCENNWNLTPIVLTRPRLVRSSMTVVPSSCN
jgi:hypothetical protein